MLASGGLVFGACGTAGSFSPEEQEAIDLAKAHLADKLGIDEAEVSLVNIEAVDWPNTSLGVPEPGKMYAQVIVPGYKVILSAAGTEYEYHAGKLGGKMSVVFAP